MTSELEHKTQAYWQVSMCYHGRVRKGMTVSKGIEITRDTMLQLNPMRPLWLRLANLQNEIIHMDKPKVAAQ